jgi:predicted TIM-barrel fold metal-dependent hydrolase
VSANDAFQPDAAWLTQAEEPAMPPKLEIVDSHLHLGEHWTPPYSWTDFAADAHAHSVSGAVFVECGWAWDVSRGVRAALPEVERAAELATRTTSDAARLRLLGVVGYVDLRSPSVAADLDAFAAAGRGWLVGIRNRVAWDPDPAVPPPSLGAPPGMLTDPSWLRGLGALVARGLALDVYAYHPQLGEVEQAARAQPEARIIVDHLGGPLGVGHYAGSNASDKHWRIGLQSLATCDNVWLKLGGVGMPIMGCDWRTGKRPPTSEELSQYWGPRIRWAIEEFGAERCMFEGNFPVDRHSLPYSVVWNAFKRICAGASNTELSWLFGRTASRVYRLGR